MVAIVAGAIRTRRFCEHLTFSVDWGFWSFGEIKGLEALGIRVWQIGPVCITVCDQ